MQPSHFQPLTMVDYRITYTLCNSAECKAKTNLAAYGQNLETSPTRE